jgi:hypothetical protein
LGALEDRGVDRHVHRSGKRFADEDPADTGSSTVGRIRWSVRHGWGLLGWGLLKSTVVRDPGDASILKLRIAGCLNVRCHGDSGIGLFSEHEPRC